MSLEKLPVLQNDVITIKEIKTFTPENVTAENNHKLHTQTETDSFNQFRNSSEMLAHVYSEGKKEGLQN